MRLRVRHVGLSLAVLAVVACGQLIGEGSSDSSTAPTGADAGTRDATATTDATTEPDAPARVTDAGACDGGPACERRVFVSSVGYRGNSIKNLVAADSLCQSLADTAGGKLAGRHWVAWLSDATTAAADRMVHGTSPYRLPNDNVVADDWTQLVSASLSQPINVDETGAQAAGALVWTGTYADGGIGAETCTSWTTSGIGGSGGTASANGGWSYSGAYNCGALLRLYCIER